MLRRPCLLAFVALLALHASASHSQLGEHWEVVGRPPFDGRQEVQFAEFKGRLWATGGRSLDCDDVTCVEVIYDDLWVSDDAKEWRLVLEHTPYGPTWQRYNDELFAFGEHLCFFSALRHRNGDTTMPLERFYWRSADGIHWDTIADPTIGQATANNERVVFKGRLQVLGTGYSTGDGVSWDYSDAYSPPPFNPWASVVSAVAHGDFIYAFYPQQVWRSPDGFQWTELEGNTDVLAINTMIGVNLLSFGGYLWVGGEFLSEAKVFRSLDGENWLSSCLTKCPLAIRGMASVRERIYVYDLNEGSKAISITCHDYLGLSHSSDRSRCGSIDLSELLRVVQLYAFGGYHCDAGSEDGYAPGLEDKGPIEGATDGEGSGSADGSMEGAMEGESPQCLPHSSDYAPEDGRISLNELLRLVQLYNAGDYHPCSDEELTEDGFCLGG